MFLLGIIWIHGLSGYANTNPLTLSLLHLIWQTLFTSFFFTPVMSLSLSSLTKHIQGMYVFPLRVRNHGLNLFADSVIQHSWNKWDFKCRSSPAWRADTTGRLDLIEDVVFDTPPQVTNNCQWTFGLSSSRAGWVSLMSVLPLKASNQRGVCPGNSSLLR